MPSKETVLIALDIETSGPNVITNAILAIGICAKNINTGSTVLKTRLCFKMESPLDFDPVTKEEFWSKYPDTLNELQENAKDPVEQITNFINTIDELDKTYDTRIITDNPSFDIGFINYYINKYLNRRPLNYRFGNGSDYRLVFDTDSYARAVLKLNYSSSWTSDSDIFSKYGFMVKKKNSHYPDDDAEYICDVHYNLYKKIME